MIRPTSARLTGRVRRPGRERLEGVFGRDVDLLNARFVRPRILERAVSEGVALYG